MIDDPFACKRVLDLYINHLVTSVRHNPKEYSVQTLHFLTGPCLKSSSDRQFTLYASVYLTLKWG